MPRPEDLFQRASSDAPIPVGLPLVVLLTGFTDAGSAVSELVDHLIATSDPQPVAVFDNDLLLDYRARRPFITFEQDHLTDYDPPRLDLSLARDALGQPFLLLSGYEPDFAWTAFTDAVLSLVDECEVKNVSWVHSIAMPVPHTRPVGTTVGGTRTDLIEAFSVWRPRTQVPATAGHYLEYRLTERGDQVVSFVLLVPHYLADSQFPTAALAGAERLMTATGLVFNMDAIVDTVDPYLARVDEQVAGNEDLQQMLKTLETRYDAYMEGRGSGDEAAGFTERDLPSADELAAELERYLANRPPNDEGKFSN